jgi:glycine cleavage system aminomethyltransferase T
VELATEGCEFDVVIRNKTIKAKVVKLPFYKKA